jgi:hypothetical protein
MDTKAQGVITKKAQDSQKSLCAKAKAYFTCTLCNYLFGTKAKAKARVQKPLHSMSTTPSMSRIGRIDDSSMQKDPLPRTIQSAMQKPEDFGVVNASLLKCFPTLSPVNYLHVATLLPVSGDQESAAQNTNTVGANDPSTGTLAYGGSAAAALQTQPIQAIAQSHLSGIIRIQCELIMYARLSSPTQELLDDSDALNATSANMTY